MENNSVFVYTKDLSNSVYEQLIEYNSRAAVPFRTMIVYGIYIYYEEYLDISYSIDLEKLLAVPNTKNIHLIVEGDVARLPRREYPNVASQILEKLAGYPMVTGLCFDFEPLDTMIEQLLGILPLLNGCGLAISCYGGVKHCKEIMHAIGHTGCFILNGYDLGDKFLQTHSPKEYAKKLEHLVRTGERLLKGCSFTVAVPAIATGNEYSSYEKDGMVIQNKYKNYDGGGGYLEAATMVLKRIKSKNFLGHTIWAITSKVKIKGVLLFPSTIFDNADLTQYLSSVKYN
ncbi:hypothetical protein HDV01_007074 [Terramyces sp. JEL0728]|nr:hypothetical protein HDV01_007074 [Terramyces sp. JEL0728]